MRILFLGSPSFAVHPLNALVQAGYEVVGVVTQPDRPAGRKRILTPPPVKEAAQSFGIPVFQPESLRGEEAAAPLAALRPDVGVVAAYGEILRKHIIDLPTHGYLNIHPSLLPLHRGPAPVTGAILAGENETGVTIMKLTAKMDSGPILAQATVPLLPTTRSGPLTDELFQIGAELLVKVITPYVDGEIELREQDHSQATITRLLKKNDGLLDWRLPALVLERQTRAFDPWPGAYTMWGDQRLKVITARVHQTYTSSYTPLAGSSGNDTVETAVGTIVAEEEGPLVATGSGALELVEVLPAGKRVMSGREWAAGQRGVVGQQFTPLPTP
jgi:methionyl-tRNA formyltransferase